MVERASFWLVLFKPSACHHANKDFVTVPASWNGVDQIVRTLYPAAHSSMAEHWDSLRNNTFDHFEKEAGFEFIEARRNIDGAVPNGPPFYSYDYFCRLPQPRTAWQVRAFLYCELRLLKLFRGDGLTGSGGEGGLREFLVPNISLASLNPLHSAVIPMTVVMPMQ